MRIFYGFAGNWCPFFEREKMFHCTFIFPAVCLCNYVCSEPRLCCVNMLSCICLSFSNWEARENHIFSYFFSLKALLASIAVSGIYAIFSNMTKITISHWDTFHAHAFCIFFFFGFCISFFLHMQVLDQPISILSNFTTAYNFHSKFFEFRENAQLRNKENLMLSEFCDSFCRYWVRFSITPDRKPGNENGKKFKIPFERIRRRKNKFPILFNVRAITKCIFLIYMQMEWRLYGSFGPFCYFVYVHIFQRTKAKKKKARAATLS